MKLHIKYFTKARKYISKHVYQNIIGDAELEPIRVIRYPCGIGAAAKRYTYQAYFKAPDDAELVRGGLIMANINRKLNSRFNPKKFEFVGDAWVNPEVTP